MLEVMGEHHVRTARAFGLPEPKIVLHYALRIAILPTVTMLALAIGGLLSSAVFAENIFSRPGIGKLIVDSANVHNYPGGAGRRADDRGAVRPRHAHRRSPRRLARSPCPRSLLSPWPPSTAIPAAPGFLRHRSFRRLRSDPLGLLGLVLVLLVLFCAVFGPWIAPYGPFKIKVPERFMQEPSWTHLFGTDNLGRDVFSRVLAGSRIALGVGGGSIAIALSIGLVLGLIAGYGPRWLDNRCCCSSIRSIPFPTVILGLTVMTLLGPSIATLMFVVVVIQTPGLCPADPHRHPLDQELRIFLADPFARQPRRGGSCWCISCPISSARCSSSPAWTSPR